MADNFKPACKLVVGIGNRPARYHETRHNVGFWFTDQLCKEKNLPWKKSTNEIEYAESEKYLIAKPSQWINTSGEGIARLKKKHSLANSEIVVVHDEIDLPLGRIRIKLGGGHAGHNGIRNSIDCLGDANFWRVRMGIGHPHRINAEGETVRQAVNDYVLSVPPASEREVLDSQISFLCKHIDGFMTTNREHVVKTTHTET